MADNDFDDITDAEYEELLLRCLEDGEFLLELLSVEEETQEVREQIRTKDEEFYQLLIEVQRACQRMFDHCLDTLQERNVLVLSEEFEVDKKELN